MNRFERHIQAGSHQIGSGFPTFIIAEMSANHNQDFNAAVEIIHAAKKAGADAVKLQTYTPDTLTIDSSSEPFKIPDGSLWAGRILYDLYKEASTPWEWQPELKAVADEAGIMLFSTAFDPSSVQFLEEKVGVDIYKIASFELVDLPLIRLVAQTGKPMIMSTGLASLGEIAEAVDAAREGGCTQLVLLECTSSYPASPADSNLRTIPHLSEMFGVPTGLSDHTLGTAVATASVALGACVIEKHFKLSDKEEGPDSAFSITPDEMKFLVDSVRTVEQALGRVDYRVTEKEMENRCFRRSLFAVENIAIGELLTEKNVRSIRPANGLAPRHLPEVLQSKAVRKIRRGEPLSWEMLVSSTM
jgi:N-acetylneuraminate synthase